LREGERRGERERERGREKKREGEDWQGERGIYDQQVKPFYLLNLKL
jgi:hypothetical protein